MNKTGKTGAHPVRYRVKETHGEWFWELYAANGRMMVAGGLIPHGEQVST